MAGSWQCQLFQSLIVSLFLSQCRKIIRMSIQQGSGPLVAANFLPCHVLVNYNRIVSIANKNARISFLIIVMNGRS